MIWSVQMCRYSEAHGSRVWVEDGLEDPPECWAVRPVSGDMLEYFPSSPLAQLLAIQIVSRVL